MILHECGETTTELFLNLKHAYPSTEMERTFPVITISLLYDSVLPVRYSLDELKLELLSPIPARVVADIL